MPNTEQEQDPEAEASGGESGEWHSDGEEDKESDDPSDEKTKVIQMCGGLGIQMRGKSSFPAIILPESVRGWQSTWFYCKDQPTPGQSTGLPPFPWLE